MDWLTHIDDFTNQLASIAESGDPSAQVPSCPEWTLADLTWHLLEVQDFWTWVITNRPAEPNDYVQPDRPSDAQLPAELRTGSSDLAAALAAADPADTAWSWTNDHTVGFTYRRQAHEAFVHLADAVGAVDGAMPNVTTAFGADGVDELITNNLDPIPPWGLFTPGNNLVSLQATDTDRRWTFRFGTFSGTSPTSGTVYEGEAQVQSTEGAAATIASAPAATLDLWLWGRADTDLLKIEGDPSLVRDLRSVAAGETQ